MRSFDAPGRGAIGISVAGRSSCASTGVVIVELMLGRCSRVSTPEASAGYRRGRRRSFRDRTLDRLEVGDPVALDLLDAPVVQQEIDVAEDLRERQVGLGHGDVAEEGLGQLVAGPR